MQEYQDLKLDEIKQINVVRYTEGGSESVLEEEKDDIERTYHYLSQIRVGKETDMACEDNTTIYYQLGEFFKAEYYAGIRYDDPEVGIEWPKVDTELNIIERDLNWKGIAGYRTGTDL